MDEGLIICMGKTRQGYACFFSFIENSLSVTWTVNKYIFTIYKLSKVTESGVGGEDIKIIKGIQC